MSPENILIIGNLGYVGPVLVKHLRHSFPTSKLNGFDTGYFSGCLVNPEVQDESNVLDSQAYGDVRYLSEKSFEAVDHVIYLAAISNDPMGHAFEKPTLDINTEAALRCAKMARQSGVKSFVFASSCSVYGAAGEHPKTEKDSLNPLTAYARSKIAAEQQLEALASSEFKITCLRFATACGASSRVRLDLVLNDFVASALTNNRIEILSDGSPWRPLIDVEDMARALRWAITRKSTQGSFFLSINAGYDSWNYQIRELAEVVKKQIPNTHVSINDNAAPDKRSYRVDFSQYYNLAPENRQFKPIEKTIDELIELFTGANFSNPDFRESHLVRLNTLNRLRQKQKLNSDLFWRV